MRRHFNYEWKKYRWNLFFTNLSYIINIIIHTKVLSLKEVSVIIMADKVTSGVTIGPADPATNTITKSLAKEFSEIVIFEYFGCLKIG